MLIQPAAVDSPYLPNPWHATTTQTEYHLPSDEWARADYNSTSVPFVALFAFFSPFSSPEA